MLHGWVNNGTCCVALIQLISITSVPRTRGELRGYDQGLPIGSVSPAGIPSMWLEAGSTMQAVAQFTQFTRRLPGGCTP